MADKKFQMGDYREVHERSAAWYEAYPEARIICDPPYPVQVGDQWFVASTVRVYKDETDLIAGQGSAWEPVPGLTSFTKNSEAMNAETSATGRALVAAGVPAKRTASEHEIRARQAEPAPVAWTDEQNAQALELQARLAALPEQNAHRILFTARGKSGVEVNQTIDLPPSWLDWWATALDVEEAKAAE